MTTSKKKILIIDDEEDIRDIIRSTLEASNLNLEIVEAENGQSALNHMNSTKFAAVISDIMMPVLGGLDLQKKLLEKGDQTPIIFLSGYPSDENYMQAFDQGMFEFLEKPIQKEILLQTIAKAFEKGQAA